MLRTAQEQWLRWCVAACLGGDPSWPNQPTAVATEALLYTGLTALVHGETTRRGHVLADDKLAAYLTQQHAEVEARYRRFEGLATSVLTALDAAKIVAIPVKGLALAEQAWPQPTERPMADLDLLIFPNDRAAAVTALRAAGLSHHGSNRHEETFLGWGDGSARPAGVVDSSVADAGESAHHNGKVELHPGWSEVFHGYTVSDDGQAMALATPGRLGDAVCRRLPPGLLAVHALGHLSACVVRRQVRAVNVIDLIFVLRRLDTSQRALMATFVSTVDSRLSAPALWLVDAVAPGELRQCGIAINEHHRRLGEPARRALQTATVESVLRSIDNRPPWAWRSSFTVSGRERLAMGRQFVVPPVEELRGANRDLSAAQLHLRRLTRASRRLVGVRR